MTIRRAFSALLVGGLVLGLSAVSRAQVDARRIEEVFKKDVLTLEDLQVVDAFMRDSVARLVRTIDFTEVAKRRAIIVTHQRPQAQYAQRFSEAAYREIAAGFDYAETGVGDPNRRFLVSTNLLILINELNDPRLVDLAIRMIAHENETVRYWAVQAATNPDLWQKLNQDRNNAGQVARRIIEACSRVVGSSSPETLLAMAQFAARSSVAGADDLLIAVADARARSYSDWTVRYELVDAGILKLLSDKMAAGGTAGPRFAKSFAQLYSFAIQRYIKAIRADVVKDTSKTYLASVLVETEEQCLSRLLGSPQSGIRRALEAGDADALQAEHDRLLGGANQMGALPSRFSFGYGPAGNGRTPAALPDPPQPKAATPPPPGTETLSGPPPQPRPPAAPGAPPQPGPRP